MARNSIPPASLARGRCDWWVLRPEQGRSLRVFEFWRQHRVDLSARGGNHHFGCPSLDRDMQLTPPALVLACAAILGTNIVHASSDDEEAIRRVVNGLPDAWNRHDMDAFGALSSPDADFVNVAGDHWKGRESIQVNHAFTHGAVSVETAGVTLPKGVYGIFRASILHVKQINVRFLRKDVAVAHVQTEALGDARTKN